MLRAQDYFLGVEDLGVVALMSRLLKLRFVVSGLGCLIQDHLDFLCPTVLDLVILQIASGLSFLVLASALTIRQNQILSRRRRLLLRPLHLPVNLRLPIPNATRSNYSLKPMPLLPTTNTPCHPSPLHMSTTPLPTLLAATRAPLLRLPSLVAATASGAHKGRVYTGVLTYFWSV